MAAAVRSPSLATSRTLGSAAKAVKIRACQDYIQNPLIGLHRLLYIVGNEERVLIVDPFNALMGARQLHNQLGPAECGDSLLLGGIIRHKRARHSHAHINRIP